MTKKRSNCLVLRPGDEKPFGYRVTHYLGMPFKVRNKTNSMF